MSKPVTKNGLGSGGKKQISKFYPIILYSQNLKKKKNENNKWMYIIQVLVT